jgi:thiamine-phosphate pyrophosphorylase
MLQDRVRSSKIARLRGLYAIVDGSAVRSPLDLCAAFLEGGAAAVQLRLKGTQGAELVRVGTEAARLCRARGALFIVNDRVDVALACGADGVHLGQEDLPLQVARRLAPDLIVGISTHSDAEIDAAEGADYLGFGPVFATRSKPGAPLPPPHGIAGLRRAVQRARAPVVAIGGITAATAAEVAKAGAACAAAIGELCHAPDPTAAARALSEALRG